jgi:hypothetical protein
MMDVKKGVTSCKSRNENVRIELTKEGQTEEKEIS